MVIIDRVHGTWMGQNPRDARGSRARGRGGQASGSGRPQLATLVSLALTAVFGCSNGPVPSGADQALLIEWANYGGDPGGLKYSPAAEITRVNVAQLRPLWTWSLGQRGRGRTDAGEEVTAGSFQATPLMLGDTLYFSTPFAGAAALDARTGHELWHYDAGGWRWSGPGGRGTFVHRGVAVWSGPDGRRVYLNSRWRLIALDAATGKPIESFGSGGEVDLSRDLRWPIHSPDLNSTSPPVIYRDLVIVGSSISDDLIHPRDPPGAVLAFDVRSGERRWAWEALPRPGTPEAATWDTVALATTGHMNIWAPMTVDTARGLVYLPVSTASNDWYGGRRPGDNLYSESLVCLDAATGALVWHQQLVRHGLWDYDPAAPPNLLTVEREGLPHDIVALPGKTGFLYAFDRLTGEPIWPMEDRPVPASDVPGEQASRTQPFPTWPRPFARQGLTPDDLVDFTPELREMAVEATKRYRLGPIFTPPSLEGTLVMPGWLGGAGWGGGAVDPVSGVIYVRSSDHPTPRRLVTADSSLHGPSAGYASDLTLSPSLELVLPARYSWRPPFWHRELRVPIIKPPYGTLTAIDLGTGEHLWQVPLGDRSDLRRHPVLRALEVPPTGIQGPPGGVVTGGGLVFITGGGSTLYAIDTHTGATLWQVDLGVEAVANPMTYRTGAGVQVVVVATGSGTRSRLRAFGLPPKAARRPD